MTTTLRLLRSLVQEGFLVKQGEQYLLGYALLRWGSIAVRSRDLVTVAMPVMEALRDSTEETVCLYVRNELNRVCVAVASSRRPIAQQSNVGEVFPMQAGSINKVFLAYEPAVREQVLRNGLVRFTDNTITDQASSGGARAGPRQGLRHEPGRGQAGRRHRQLPDLEPGRLHPRGHHRGWSNPAGDAQSPGATVDRARPAAAEISQQLGWLGAAA